MEAVTASQNTDSTTLRIYKTTDELLDAVATRQRWTKKVAADEAAKLLAEKHGVHPSRPRRRESHAGSAG